ncbi:hypothetical protein [Streptomyces sp. Z26]|uniref:hypothetical protein n=1 Tax=Streptomyces sp. Z26 TaxID=2500177 RepID=UPI000FCA7E18|nr:hypothetical protein [Streptomyces sp. Z26]
MSGTGRRLRTGPASPPVRARLAARCRGAAGRREYVSPPGGDGPAPPARGEPEPYGDGVPAGTTGV